MRIPGTSLSQAIKMQNILEAKLKGFSEIENTFSKIGTAEIATDPMPPNVADGFIILKSRATWENPNLPKTELVAKIEKTVNEIPGNNYEFTQPIQMRFNELIAGVRSDIAIKVFGDDLTVLNKVANEINGVLSQIDGVADNKVEQTTGLPVITVEFNREKLAKFGIKLSQAQQVLTTAIGGKELGLIYEGDSQFEIIARLKEEERNNLESIKNIPLQVQGEVGEHGTSLVPISQSVQFNEPPPPYIRLRDVAEIKKSENANQISRENGKRRIVVTANVRGRDLGSFVADAQKNIESKILLPAGYWISWGGQFEQLISAKNRLMIVIPFSLLIIFLLIYFTLKSISDSLIVFTGVPLALTGGIFALWLRGIPFSVSAAVGFIALSGIAVLNGLVLISFINSLATEGSYSKFKNIIIEGAITRLRPVLMTALVASLGFIPMALSTGTGAEVQRPLATVVIGGIISSTLLTLVVLPCLKAIFIKDN